MHQAMKELPLVEDYGDGFCSRLTEWGGMIVSYEGRVRIRRKDTEILEFSPKKPYQMTIDVASRNLAAAQKAK